MVIDREWGSTDSKIGVGGDANYTQLASQVGRKSQVQLSSFVCFGPGLRWAEVNAPNSRRWQQRRFSWTGYCSAITSRSQSVPRGERAMLVLIGAVLVFFCCPELQLKIRINEEEESVNREEKKSVFARWSE